MTGRGIQNDPYIISDWNDFITAIGTTDAYVEFPKVLVHTQDRNVDPNKLYTDANGVVQTNVQPSDLVNLYENTFVLDANDYAPGGITSTITMSCTDINGYGGYIKNLASTTVDIFENTVDTSVNQLAILNINVENVSFINTTAASMNYTKCIFSGRAKGDSAHHTTVFGDKNNTHSSIYNSCAFNFYIVGVYDLFNYLNYGGFVYAGPMYDCRLEINHVNNNDIVAAGTLWIRFEKSYLTGVIANSVSVTITAQSHYSVIEVEKDSGITVNDAQGGTVQLILINNEMYTGTIPTGCVGITTAQSKDVSYLNSIGFPIQL